MSEERGGAALSAADAGVATQAQGRAPSPAGWLANGVTLAETLEVEGVEASALIEALRADVCQGALARATPLGWALDWPETSTRKPLWAFEGPQPDRGPGVLFPTDEQAATALRLLDAVALDLGLGRGHVLPVFENPIRRVMEMEVLCSLPSLDSGAVMDQVSTFLHLGVPVAAVLGLRYEGGGRWTGMRPQQRWDKVLLSPRGEQLRERLPEEFATAPEEGFGLLIARIVNGGIALDLPAGLDLPALSGVLGAVSAAADLHGVGLLVEGEVEGSGLACLQIEALDGRLRLTLPDLPASGRSGRLLDGVLRSVCAQGGSVSNRGRRTRLGVRHAASDAALLSLIDASLRHPALLRLGSAADVGVWAPTRRPDEQPGDVPSMIARQLAPGEDAPHLGAVAALLEGSQFSLEAGRLSVAGGPNALGTDRVGIAWHGLLAAATMCKRTGERPRYPLSAYCLPSVLGEDLEQLIEEIAAIGLSIDAPALRAALHQGLPVLADMACGPARIRIRRALVERTLAGAWSALALEIGIGGMPATAPHLALAALAEPGGTKAGQAGQGAQNWRSLPLARHGTQWLGRVTLPLSTAVTGPCAGLIPPMALGIAFDRQHAFALAPDETWSAAATSSIALPETWPAAVPACGLDGPGLVLGL